MLRSFRGGPPEQITRLTAVDLSDPDLQFESVERRLAAVGCIAATEEATLFVAAAPDGATLETWLRRRELGEPPSWIIGMVSFCGRQYQIAPGVYVPRPQTEQLAWVAATMLPSAGRAIDLCTGSGVVAAHLRAEVPGSTVVGIDIDPRSARCARGNGVPTAVADLAAAVGGHVTFDVVTAVAPYVPTGEMRLLPADVQRYEPARALDGGVDGLDLVRRVIAAAGVLLHIGGRLVIEVGGDQDDLLASTLERSGFRVVTPFCDDDGDLRGIVAELVHHPDRRRVGWE